MTTEKVTVLLAGTKVRNTVELLDYLKRRDCLVRSAESYQDAARLLRHHKFDLVLSDFLISDGTAYALVPLLGGSDTSMFISDTVAGGCWWMNAMYEGQDHSKEPGMHPSEFKAQLDQFLTDRFRRGTQRTFLAWDEAGSNQSFVRRLLLLLLATLTAVGIFLFGVFVRKQPHSSASASSMTSPSRLVHPSKKEHAQTRPPRAMQLRLDQA